MLEKDMRHYYIWTVGCQMNQSESERLSAALLRLGYQAADSADAADLVLLNSCVVRGNAENKVINKLDSLRGLKKRKPGVTIALTGCLVDSNTDELKRKFSHVDYFLKSGVYPEWLPRVVAGEDLPREPSVSTGVPIIYGCNNFCTYCIVPYRRGRERSRAISEITGEVRELTRRGTREVILLGQNVNSYGHDLSDRPELPDLLAGLNKIDRLSRIRFITSHPKDVSLKLIQAMANLDKVAKYLSLPVQAGSDRVLRAMRRGYTTEDYRGLVRMIRDHLPSVAITTDVIVGFPGETEADFAETIRLLSDIRFDQVHVAAYSPRPGTIAAREMEDNVPPGVKKARLREIERLEERIAAEINEKLLGKETPILVQGKQGGRFFGRTEGDKLVFLTAGSDLTGRLLKVRITRTSPWSLSGEALA